MNDEFAPGLGVSVTRKAARRRDEVVLVSYTPQPPKNSPMPKPAERPKSPKDYTSTDELYFTGQRIEQLCSPSFEAQPYYAEIVRRDPGDCRANTALGILLCKQWRWREAAKYLRHAVARATANHIRPRDGEAFYYLGVALRGQAGSYSIHKRDYWAAKLSEAADAFLKASWGVAWQSPSLFQLAEIQCNRQRFDVALETVDRCLALSRRNTKAINLRAAILRHLGRFDEAAACASEALAIDPLDVWSPVERFHADTRINADLQSPEIAGPTVRIPPGLLARQVPGLLELIVDYANSGLEREAGAVAWSATTSSDGLRGWSIRGVDPLLHYYAGYFAPGFQGSGLDMQ